MNELLLRGVAADNPLHFMASLGALVVTDQVDPGGRAALGWRSEDGSGVRPVLRTRLDVAGWCERVAAWLVKASRVGEAGKADAERRVKDATKARKDAVDDLKKGLREAKDEVGKLGLRGGDKAGFIEARVASLRAQLAASEAEVRDARLALGEVLGRGYAHLGEVIKCPVDLFRDNVARARAAGDDALVRHLAGLASDARIDGSDEVQPSPYSFSNGSSGKALLKDWREMANAATASGLRAAIVGDELLIGEFTALNWDPADNRSAALQWEDPAASGKRAQVEHNALAFLALGMLPVVPMKGLGVEAVGYDHGFTWPIWSPCLERPLVEALLSTPAAELGWTPAVRAARGVLEVWRAEEVNPTGKRKFFGPAAPLARPHP
jgi:hypothetical protein